MIPDPTEILDMQIDAQIGLIDENGKYPCCYCGARHDPENMFLISANPASPLMCVDCGDAENERIASKV